MLLFIAQMKKRKKWKEGLHFRTVLYATLLVILNAKLGAFSSDFDFLSFELLTGGSSSSISSILHS